MTKIISQNISQKIDINEEQQGFRHNSSRVDAIFILRLIVEKFIEYEYNKSTFLCFVDLT